MIGLKTWGIGHGRTRQPGADLRHIGLHCHIRPGLGRIGPRAINTGGQGGSFALPGPQAGHTGQMWIIC